MHTPWVGICPGCRDPVSHYCGYAEFPPGAITMYMCRFKGTGQSARSGSWLQY